MDDYLLAECVIDNLVLDKVIEPPGAWLRTGKGIQTYWADFTRVLSGHLVCFCVSVIDNTHVITKNAFVNQARFFGIDFDNILEKCAM
jgi:hypothetical protein